MVSIKLNVEVTERDLSEGITRDCERCPVALAITRAVQKATGLEPRTNYYTVSNLKMSFVNKTNGDWLYTIEHPPEVIEFIRNFDSKHYPVGPFSFTAITQPQLN